MRVHSRMTRHVVCVFPEDLLLDAFSLMNEVGCRHLPVVKNGRLVGVLSDRDILPFAHIEDETVVVDPGLTVQRAMTRDVMTCTPRAPIGEVVDIMLKNRIDALPIVNAYGGLVGIVTSTDLLKIFREQIEPDVASSPLPLEFELRGQKSPVARVATTEQA